MTCKHSVYDLQTWCLRLANIVFRRRKEVNFYKYIYYLATSFSIFVGCKTGMMIKKHLKKLS